MQARQRTSARLLIGVGAATAAAHIGNNFTTYLIGGLIDQRHFSPFQMGAWSMTECLSYAVAMFALAPRSASLSPRFLVAIAGVLVVVAQFAGAAVHDYPLLLATRVATGIGFGTANAAVNLAAGRTTYPARAISLGITLQTILYAGINIGLPLVGQRFGVGGMFVALGLLSAGLLVLSSTLPGGQPVKARPVLAEVPRETHGRDERRVLLAMAFFTFGSLAIWPFMERAAHAIGISAVLFGRYQSVATLGSALGNLLLAMLVTRLPRGLSLVMALAACGTACALLTTVSSPAAFAIALAVYNVSWFVTYPLLLGIGFAVEPSGRLAVSCSAVWLLMMALGSLATGTLAQVLGGYAPAGLLGLAFCGAAGVVAWPLARRLDGESLATPNDAQPSTSG